MSLAVAVVEAGPGCWGGEKWEMALSTMVVLRMLTTSASTTSTRTAFLETFSSILCLKLIYE